ncbi:hypothetical protein DSM25559_3121 [Agrobacterium rosae]|uniref:Uncharacterized protein n=1 Tax=Agrobacterium rosae TaxID=1972867 RepID=A0A1R3TSZ8_9HYPH|nr:hypothetical protein DSM25559_3121 [Agrobacterium rosae]
MNYGYLFANHSLAPQREANHTVIIRNVSTTFVKS